MSSSNGNGTPNPKPTPDEKTSSETSSTPEATGSQPPSSTSESETSPPRPTDHLKPWQFKKGESGNPGGKRGSRPRKVSLLAALKQHAREHPEALAEVAENLFYVASKLKDQRCIPAAALLLLRLDPPNMGDARETVTLHESIVGTLGPVEPRVIDVEVVDTPKEET
jgi:hypothetical protein